MSINSNIATYAAGNKYPLKIVCWNIANAKRDNDYYPLGDRIPGVIAALRDMSPDVLVWLEAGRDNMHNGSVVTFTEIAARIQKETGLVYAGIDMLNASASPFGKAVFYNNKTAFVNKLAQRWTTDPFPSGAHYGNAMTTVEVFPVSDSRVVFDAMIRVGAVHLPMNLEARLQVCAFIKNCGDVDIVMGDFNTFPDNGASEMLNVLSEQFTEALPADTEVTFHAYEHDTITIRNDLLGVMPLARVISSDVDNSVIVPVSWLDHCMVNREYRGDVTASVYAGIIGNTSDHLPIIACVG